MMHHEALIKEIFESVQGEGPYIGCNQLFIRFSSCNLKCSYCDTYFETEFNEYTPKELAFEVEKYKNIHSVSLTGGEPLLYYDFLADFLPLIKNKIIYLETNGTLCENLKKVIKFTNIIAADIKLPSAAGLNDMFDIHSKFLEIAKKNKKEVFAKIVFDENITEEEITKVLSIVKKYNILAVLQPKTEEETIKLSPEFINNIFRKFVSQYENVRLIPQVHKFLNIK